MALNAYFLVEGEISGAWKGSCTAAGHEDKMEIVSWNHGFTQPITGAAESAFGGSATSRATHADLTLVKYYDNASDEILKACWTGEQLKKCQLQIFRSSGDPNTGASTNYLTIDLEKAYIASYDIGSSGEDLPTETIRIAYKKVTYTFTPTDPTGAAGDQVPLSCDLATNTIA